MRPNMVVKGGGCEPPFSEDVWKQIQIGEHGFEVCGIIALFSFWRKGVKNTSNISYNVIIRIIIYFLAFLPSVTASPAAAVGPMDMNFGRKVCFDYGMPIFGKSRS